jgi:DNA-binding response OmpR family regulator
MKAHVIMLISSDPEVKRLVGDEVLAARHGLRFHTDRDRAMRELNNDGHDIDLAIIDFVPGINGLTLFTAAREHVPVLAVLDPDAAAMQSVLLRHGASGCLTKPFTAEELRQAIRSLLDPTAAAVA